VNFAEMTALAFFMAYECWKLITIACFDLRASIEFLLEIKTQRKSPGFPRGRTVLRASPTQINIQVPFENVVDKVMAIDASGSATSSVKSRHLQILALSRKAMKPTPGDMSRRFCT
jgi:hypothetical protein